MLQYVFVAWIGMAPAEVPVPDAPVEPASPEAPVEPASPEAPPEPESPEAPVEPESSEAPPPTEPLPEHEHNPPLPEPPRFPPGWANNPQPIRRGVTFEAVVGPLFCARNFCDGFRAGGFGGFAAGYRRRIIGGQVFVMGGGGRYHESGDPLSVVATGFGLELVPPIERVPKLDLFFSFRLGIEHVSSAATTVVTDDNGEESFVPIDVKILRGVAILGAGIRGFIRPRVSLGLRVDVWLGFAGRVCIEGLGQRQCDNVNEAVLDPAQLPLLITTGPIVHYTLGPLPREERPPRTYKSRKGR